MATASTVTAASMTSSAQLTARSHYVDLPNLTRQAHKKGLCGLVRPLGSVAISIWQRR